jgi:hypothetical protein
MHSDYVGFGWRTFISLMVSAFAAFIDVNGNLSNASFCHKNMGRHFAMLTL